MVDMVNKVAGEEQNSSAKTIFEPHIAAMLEKTDQEILTSQTKQMNLQYECILNNKKTWLHDYKFFIQLPDDKPGIGGISFDITKLKFGIHKDLSHPSQGVGNHPKTFHEQFFVMIDVRF